MRILKKTISVLVLVFFVASLTVGSASAGYCKNKCDCNKDKCCDWGCKDKCNHKDKCGCGCGCDYDFDFDAFFGGSFFGYDCFLGNGCFFGTGDSWIDGWNDCC
ncbi:MULTISPECIES: hypothetical protein [Methanosarcina]|uniref:Uncharacterized protein n=1 Tax=Methanosarcina barkeri MS TaxID=1434108 RepID=A0A0E3QW97_METBA|nr:MULTISPECIES: hypothetical protein [Methanosarcina]AKB55922.1 hypothetical protein MSBRM_2924 [Methanosarcina barkeri MS]OED02522.1 hypothetical protein A9239_14315 [Methanosarcina sp. A14]